MNKCRPAPMKRKCPNSKMPTSENPPQDGHFYTPQKLCLSRSHLANREGIAWTKLSPCRFLPVPGWEGGSGAAWRHNPPGNICPGGESAKDASRVKGSNPLCLLLFTPSQRGPPPKKKRKTPHCLDLYKKSRWILIKSQRRGTSLTVTDPPPAPTFHFFRDTHFAVESQTTPKKRPS